MSNRKVNISCCSVKRHIKGFGYGENIGNVYTNPFALYGGNLNGEISGSSSLHANKSEFETLLQKKK